MSRKIKMKDFGPNWVITFFYMSIGVCDRRNDLQFGVTVEAHLEGHNPEHGSGISEETMENFYEHINSVLGSEIFRYDRLQGRKISKVLKKIFSKQVLKHFEENNTKVVFEDSNGAFETRFGQRRRVNLN
jgi:hypothetical protein